MAHKIEFHEDRSVNGVNVGSRAWTMIRSLIYPVVYTVTMLTLAFAVDRWAPSRRADPALRRLAIQMTCFNTMLLGLLDHLKYTYANGYVVHFYGAVSEHGVGYFVMSSLVYLVVTDFLLWLQHYLFHSRLLYRFHRLHHRFVYPTAFDFGATHPVDTLAIYAVYQMVPLLLPIHSAVAYTYAVMGNIYAILYHGAGLDLWRSLRTDPDFHNVHHSLGKYNYGIGFLTTFWDRLLGTYREPVQ